MPNWKKIIVSGSNAALNSLSITSTLSVTGSTFLSASSGIALQLYGSGSTIFSISGSSSEIFRISDDGSSSNLVSVSSGNTTILSINSNKIVSISGSLIVTGSITGSVFGTASWATNALTASYGNITGSLFGTSSWALNAVSASYITGSIFSSTNPALSASYALTASYALNGGGGPPVTPGGANTTIQFNSNGAFSGSANFTFDSASSAVQLTGSLQIAAATNTYPVLSTVLSTLYDTDSSASINWASRTLKNINESNVIDWGNNELYSNTAGPGNLSVNWDDRRLFDTTGTQKSIDWEERILVDHTGATALSYTSSMISNGIRLYGTASLALTSSFTISASFVTSIKSGVVSTFTGNPKTGSVTFSPAYANANYAVTVTGGTGTARSWTVESKTSTGFIINSNSNTAISGEVNWIAVPYNT